VSQGCNTYATQLVDVNAQFGDVNAQQKQEQLTAQELMCSGATTVAVGFMAALTWPALFFYALALGFDIWAAVASWAAGKAIEMEVANLNNDAVAMGLKVVPAPEC